MRTNLIDAERMAFFSLHPTRGRAISDLLESSYFVWDKGELQPDYDMPHVAAAWFKLEMGYVPNWNEVADNRAWEFALGSNDRKEKSMEEIQDFHDYILPQYLTATEWPLYYNLRNQSAIVTVPDNVSDEWLEVCIEFCQQVLLARTDHDSTSVLSPHELETRELHFNYYKRTNDALADVLVEMLVDKGIIAQDKIGDVEEIKNELNRRKFNHEYSQAGNRASRYNSENKDSKELVKPVLTRLLALRANRLGRTKEHHEPCTSDQYGNSHRLW
jgi:hypothetical protein